MKKIFIYILFIWMLVIAFGFYKIGQKQKLKEIKNRALSIEKDCYSNEELELIIFGESQK